MVEQHLGVWLWEGPAPGKTAFDYPALVLFNALGGGAAPTFIVLAGVGASLMVRRRAAPDLTLLLRGLTVLGFGYLLSFLTPSWFTWRSWFVLHLMGFGIASTPLWRRASTPVLLTVAAATLIATPWVQHWLETPTQLSNPRMAGWADGETVDAVVVAGGHVRLALAESQFPLLPWFSLFLFGLVSGRFIADDRPGTLSTLAAITVAGGAALTILGVSWPDAPELLERGLRFNVPFFPASPAQALLLAGLVLVVVRGTLAFEQRHPLHERGFLVTLGRASLSLLLVHVVMFRELTRPLDLWQTLSPGLALIIMLAFVALAGLAARSWQRIDYRGGAEWWLRKIAP
jgi:uncharacterized membrane protein